MQWPFLSRSKPRLQTHLPSSSRTSCSDQAGRVAARPSRSGCPCSCVRSRVCRHLPSRTSFGPGLFGIERQPVLHATAVLVAFEAALADAPCCRRGLVRARLAERFFLHAAAVLWQTGFAVRAGCPARQCHAPATSTANEATSCRRRRRFPNASRSVPDRTANAAASRTASTGSWRWQWRSRHRARCCSAWPGTGKTVVARRSGRIVRCPAHRR